MIFMPSFSYSLCTMEFDKNTLYLLVEITNPATTHVISTYATIEATHWGYGHVYKVVHATAPPPPRVPKAQPLTARLYLTNGINVKREIETSKALVCTSNLALQKQGYRELVFHASECILKCTEGAKNHFSFTSLYFKTEPRALAPLLQQVATLKRPRDDAESLMSNALWNIDLTEKNLRRQEDGLREAKRARTEAQEKLKEAEAVLAQLPIDSLFLPLNGK